MAKFFDAGLGELLNEILRRYLDERKPPAPSVRCDVDPVSEQPQVERERPRPSSPI